MVKKNKKKVSLHQWIYIGLGLLVIDQILKALIVAKEEFFRSAILSMHLVVNTGASFSILPGSNSLLIWISLIIIGLFLFYFDKIEKPYIGWSFLAMGGVLSNLIDRIFRAGVIDYFDIHWWPVFNIADSMIVIGILTCIIIMIREDWKEYKNKKIRKITKKSRIRK